MTVYLKDFRQRPVTLEITRARPGSPPQGVHRKLAEPVTVQPEKT